MFALNKKFIVIILLIVIIAAAGAGAVMMMGGEEEKQSKPKPVEKTETMPMASGWISSPDAADGGPTSAEIAMNVSDKEMLSMSINVTIMDDDGSHSQTDEGSEPDRVRITVGKDAFEVATEMTSGEGSASKQYGPSDLNNENGSLSIKIEGVEFGGGVHPTGPIGIVPIPFLVYIDQGCQYNIEITYTYNDYGGKAPKDDSQDKEK